MIYLIAGHRPDEPGACYKHFCEHSEAVLWVSEIAEHLGPHHAHIVPTGTNEQRVGYVNAKEPGAVVEVHFNSAIKSTPRTFGHLAMYQPTSARSKKLAKAINKAVAKHGSRDRGIYEGYYRLDKSLGLAFVLQDVLMPAVIIEPEFIHQIEMIEKMRGPSCLEIANALRVFDYNLCGDEW